MSDKLKAAILAFEDFLNEPPQYEDKRMVREYRHEAYRKWSELRDQITAALSAQEWQDISTADRYTTAWLFTPGARLGPDCADNVRLDSPCNWAWATMWMPAQIPAPPVAIIADDRANQTGERS